MTYITLVLPFNASGDVAKRLLSTVWLFKIASHRLLDIAKQTLVLPRTDTGWKITFRRVTYDVIPNRRYADGVVTLIRGIYESCRHLGVGFKSVELSDWLMFQQSEKEYPPRNITLKPGYEVHVTTISYSGESYRDVVKPSIPKSFSTLVDKIIEESQEYTGRVVVKDSSVRDCTTWVRGEVQVTVPVDFYYKHMARHREPKGNLIGGVDVNVDRVNLAIIDENGNLRGYKTFWFREATARGYPRRSARRVIGARIHEMLDYAHHQGVSILTLENPEVLGKLRLLWVKHGERGHENYNYRVSAFRCRVIEMIALKAPLYALEIKYVNPAGTTNSKDHDEAMRRYGLDKHASSAYLIATRSLNQKR